MKLQKTVIVGKPLDAVFGYLSDFTTTTDWDPGTVLTVTQHGDGGVGTTYLNTSTFLGRETRLTYVVREFVPGERIRLRGENNTVTAVDTMTFRSVDAGTEVTPALLKEHNLAKRLLLPVKLLGGGTLDRPVRIRVHAASAAARQKVEAAGGAVELLKPKS